MKPIVKGHLVTFLCHSFLEDGSLIDDEEDVEPLRFKAGIKAGNQFASTISSSLIGMVVNETKHFRVPPALAFGEVDSKKVFKLERRAERHIRVGDEMQLKISDESGEAVVQGTVVKLDHRYAHVDTNHPLAGQKIVLKITVLAVD